MKTLPKLAREATDADLQKGFEAHLEETKLHVDKLMQVFELVGEKAKAEKCPAIDGITKEHDEFMSEEKPSPVITDMFLTGAGARAEHYEIAAYTGLITMAQALGEKGAVPLLRENLTQEEAALGKLEKAAQRLARTNA